MQYFGENQSGIFIKNKIFWKKPESTWQKYELAKLSSSKVSNKEQNVLLSSQLGTISAGLSREKKIIF